MCVVICVSRGGSIRVNLACEWGAAGVLQMVQLGLLVLQGCLWFRVVLTYWQESH